MQRGSFQRFGNCRSDTDQGPGERCIKIIKQEDKLDTKAWTNGINQSNESSGNKNNECAKVSDGKYRERMSQKLERNIELARCSEENWYGDIPSQSNQVDARSSNCVVMSNNDKNTNSLHEADNINQFRRNVRNDSVSGKSDMLNKDDHSDEGERENSEVSSGRENNNSIGVHDQSVNDGQLLVIILFYEVSDGDGYVLILVIE